MKHYFVANDIADEVKKRSILISSSGPSTYKLMRSLVGDASEVDKKMFDELVKLVKDYHEPKPSTIVQRYKFHTRTQSQEESIARYVAALRVIAEHCNFKDTLQDMLRDRIVCGIANEGVQRRLLAESELTYEKAFEIAQAAKDTRDLQLKSHSTSSGQVHYSTCAQSRPKGPVERMNCSRCGGPHPPATCKYKDAECFYCKKKGHISKVCWSKGSLPANKPAGGGVRRGVPRSTHYVSEDKAIEDNSYMMFNLHNRGSDPRQPIILDFTINNVPVKMEFDTGASLSIISYQTYKHIAKVNKTEQLQKSNIILKTYTGESLNIIGEISVCVSYGGKKEELSVLVVDGDGQT